MTNITQDNYVPNKLWKETKTVKYIWISGIVLSAACLILQLLLFKLLPKIRKMDQKVLTQLTVARLMFTLLEFMIVYRLFYGNTESVLFALFVYSDVIIVCWVIVFTKILYDKVVLVFGLKKWNFILLSFLIWILMTPIGALFPIVNAYGYGYLYLRWYRRFKNIIMIANLCSFAKIFLAIRKTKNKEVNSNFTSMMVTWAMTFFLCCVTNFGAFFRVEWVDFKFFDFDSLSPVLYSFFVTVFIWDSLQAIPITVIFLILVKNSKRDAIQPVTKTLSDP